MFEIKFNEAKLVKGIFESISAIVAETKMVFAPEGISLNSIDDGRICLISLFLDSSDFDDYKCEISYELGLNIEDLVKILKRSGGSDKITFKYKPETKKISILIKKEGSKKSRQFSLQLIELGDSGIKPEALESIEYSAQVQVPVSYLDEAIKDADIFSDTLIVKMSDEEGIIFKAEGQIGESECILEKDDDGVEDFKVESSGEGTFALDYLKNIIKIGSIADKVSLHLNSETPLKAKFNIMANSSFSYYLAPRIEEEEDDYDEDY